MPNYFSWDGYCRSLIQETASHEYKIQRKHRTLDDFMRYIQYQLKLLEKIQKKREVSTRAASCTVVLEHGLFIVVWDVSLAGNQLFS